MKLSALVSSSFFVVVSSIASAQSSTSFLHDARLNRPNETAAIGFTCAVDAGRVVLGSPSAGAVFVYREQPMGGFELEATLINPVNGGATFGASIAYDDPYLVVGAHGENNWTFWHGAAYVYERVGTAWIQRAHLNPYAGAEAQFGYQVDISGDVLIVSALSGFGMTEYSGSAYVYRRNGVNWNAELGMVPDDWDVHSFGRSVAIFGDRALVGSLKAGSPNQPGAVYVFERSAGSWSQVAKLEVPIATPSRYLGHAVGLSSNRIVASECDPYSNLAPGAVHTWLWSGSAWTYEQRLAAAGITPWEQFGRSLVVDDDRVLVSAPRRGSGVLYAYDLAGGVWSESAQLTPPDALPAQDFGLSIASDGYRLVVGAPGWNDGTQQSAAQLYRIFDLPLIGETHCTSAAVECPCGSASAHIPKSGCANSTGYGGRLYGLGSTSVASADLRLVAEGLVPGRVTRLIGALSSLANGSFRPLADGALCIASPREAFWPVWADFSGHSEWSGYFGNQLGWSAGQEWHFQVWYRDPLTPCGGRVNLSNMLSVTLKP